MVLLIDNYDSFVHNLARYFQRLGQETMVVRNDALTLSEIDQLRPDAIVISPGPCGPSQAGISVSVVQQYWQRLPILGICLGHQTIAAALGAQIVRAPRPIHGQSSNILHAGDDLFFGIPSPLRAARYHSLIVAESTIPDTLRVVARTEDNIVMALQGRHQPLFGLQFHPESILTDCGYAILQNFLSIAGLRAGPGEQAQQINGAADTLAGFDEYRPGDRPVAKLPDQPITF